MPNKVQLKIYEIGHACSPLMCCRITVEGVQVRDGNELDLNRFHSNSIRSIRHRLDSCFVLFEVCMPLFFLFFFGF